MAVLFSDDFNRANSTITLGAAWTAVKGTWGVNNNEGYSASNGYIDLAITSNLGDGNYRISYDGKGELADVAGWSIPGVVFRYINSTTYLRVTFFNATLDIEKMDNGSYSLLKRVTTVSPPLGDDTFYHFEITCNGDTIQVKVDGTLVSTYTLSSADNTKFGSSDVVGMILENGDNPTIRAKWDNFLVESLSTTHLVSGSSNGNVLVSANPFGIFKRSGEIDVKSELQSSPNIVLTSESTLNVSSGASGVSKKIMYNMGSSSIGSTISGQVHVVHRTPGSSEATVSLESTATRILMATSNIASNVGVSATPTLIKTASSSISVVSLMNSVASLVLHSESQSDISLSAQAYPRHINSVFADIDIQFDTHADQSAVIPSSGTIDINYDVESAPVLTIMSEAESTTRISVAANASKIVHTNGDINIASLLNANSAHISMASGIVDLVFSTSVYVPVLYEASGEANILSSSRAELKVIYGTSGNSLIESSASGDTIFVHGASSITNITSGVVSRAKIIASMKGIIPIRLKADSKPIYITYANGDVVIHSSTDVRPDAEIIDVIEVEGQRVLVVKLRGDFN